MFKFEYIFVNNPGKDYMVHWDKAIPITVLAEDVKQAREKMKKVLNMEIRTDRFREPEYLFRLKSVTELNENLPN